MSILMREGRCGSFPATLGAIPAGTSGWQCRCFSDPISLKSYSEGFHNVGMKNYINSASSLFPFPGKKERTENY